MLSKQRGAVTNRSELWPLFKLGSLSFFAGLSVYLGVVVVLMFAVLMQLDGSAAGTAITFESQLVVVGCLCVVVVIPLILLWRFQRAIRTYGRATFAGLFCGCGALSLLVVFSFGNPDGAHWRSVAWASLGALVGFPLASIALLAIYNVARKPPPIQDGTLCPGCAYCLIGNTSSICPECGRPFTLAELKTAGGRSH